MVKKGLVNVLSLFIYQFIRVNYKDEGVCLLLNEEDKTYPKKKQKDTGVNTIDVIHGGSIVGKIKITSTFLYFNFAYPGSEEVEIDFLPLLEVGKSSKQIFESLQFVVRTKLAVDLEKSIGIMDFRANPRRRNPASSSLGAIAVAGIAGFMIGKSK